MVKQKPTQAQRVLQYIKEFGSITRAEALTDIGVANLPAVVDDLRHKHGVNIITNEVSKIGMYGTKVTYAKYTLGEEDGNKEFGN